MQPAEKNPGCLLHRIAGNFRVTQKILFEGYLSCLV